MKKRFRALFIMLLMMAVFAMASCSSSEFGGGSFIVRATVTEEATGTVDILIKGYDN